MLHVWGCIINKSDSTPFFCYGVFDEGKGVNNLFKWLYLEGEDILCRLHRQEYNVIQRPLWGPHAADTYEAVNLCKLPRKVLNEPEPNVPGNSYLVPRGAINAMHEYQPTANIAHTHTKNSTLAYVILGRRRPISDVVSLHPTAVWWRH